jgi:hypothetical protein
MDLPLAAKFEIKSSVVSRKQILKSEEINDREQGI